MDDIVKAALLKWPNVPHCYGWLALDARGDWYMRDDRIQHRGPFPQVKGSRIDHDKLLAFIQRNYSHDEAGAWFFQNGPQRVYVELEAAPWVWRVERVDTVKEAPGGHFTVHSHTGLPAQVQASWLDENGRLFLATDIGLGLVHTMDMGIAAQAVEQGIWQPAEMRWAQMPKHFAFQLKPAPGAAQR